MGKLSGKRVRHMYSLIMFNISSLVRPGKRVRYLVSSDQHSLLVVIVADYSLVVVFVAVIY